MAIVNNYNDISIRILNYIYNLEYNRGIIRTILMTLKPIKNMDKLMFDMFTILADELRKGNPNGII